MESGKAHDIYIAYRAALAYVEVELPSKDRSVGSAFHVGEGVFVTARHVVEGNNILEVASTTSFDAPLTGEEAEHALVRLHKGDEVIPVHPVWPRVFDVDEGPLLHPNDDVDVAVFRVRDIDSYTPVVPLGSHLDDWLGEGDFVLSEAIVLGYPPVPMTTEPVLIGARAEVNAQVDLYDTNGVHFILSSMPRGGFSGGVAISEYGFALGVVTRSLTSNHSPVEMGFMTVTSIEPIYECLAEYNLLPDIQAEGWDGHWNSTSLEFRHPDAKSPLGLEISEGFLVSAALRIFDDGKKYALTIMCDHNQEAFESAIRAAESALSRYRYTRSEIRPGHDSP